MKKQKYKQSLTFLDLETTDLDSRRGRIMEVGAVHTDFMFDQKAGKVTAHFGEELSILVNPEGHIAPAALAVTGIRLEDLKAASPWSYVQERVQQFIHGRRLSGHNFRFDLGFLRAQGIAAENSYIDTLEAALTIMPLEESHSLEYLAERLAVLEGSPHRALVDCKNNARVLAEIMNEFLRFPVSLQKEIKKALAVSHLDFADLFLDLPLVKLFHLESARTRRVHPAAPFPFSWPPDSLVSLPLSFALKQQWIESLATEKQKAIVGAPQDIYLRNILPGQALPEPQMVLCEKRFVRLRSLGSYGALVARVLIKILILRYLHNSADLNRAKWQPEERMLLAGLAFDSRVCPAHRCQFLKLLQPRGSKVYFTSLANLFSLVKCQPRKFRQHKLLLLDLVSIEQEFTENLMRSLSLEQLRIRLAQVYKLETHIPPLIDDLPTEVETLANELDLFFGLLGGTYATAAGHFIENLIVDEMERAAQRFQKFLYPAEKLLQTINQFASFLEDKTKVATEEVVLELGALRSELGSAAKFIETFFLKPAPEEIYFFKYNARYFELGAVPVNIAQRWEEFCANFAGVTIADTSLPNISWSYFQKRLGLTKLKIERSPVVGNQNPISVQITRRPLPQAEVLALLDSLTGNTLFVVPNEGQLAQYYHLINERLGQRAAVHAPRLSGNPRLIRARFLRNDETHPQILLLTNYSLLHAWYSLPGPLRNLIVLRLPFEAPLTKPSLFGLPEGRGFPDHILPRAVQHLHLILCRFLSCPGEGKQIFLWDSRIRSDYDGEFMNYLREFPDFEISTE